MTIYDKFPAPKPGDPQISAGLLSAMRAQLIQIAQMPGSPEGAPADVFIRNDTGSDLAEFRVVGLGDTVLDPTSDAVTFKQVVCLSGETPTIASYTRLFGILQEPIADGKIGRAMMIGVTPVQIEVSDADHGWADVTNNDTSKLTSGKGGGAQILYKEAGTGALWAIVRLGTVAPPRWQ